MPDINKTKLPGTSGGGLSSRGSGAGGVYVSGNVATLFGFVRVYAQRDLWMLEFIWNGYYYETSGKCEQLPSNLALTRRASKFARQIVEKNGNITNWY
ncbi:hypothetical protein JYQ62_02120 [Nostoc sp. UHCC 0702]|nr:hypothetical protein JYQ62_02120 [Nostoc sp. UHCC 0702]